MGHTEAGMIVGKLYFEYEMLKSNVEWLNLHWGYI